MFSLVETDHVFTSQRCELENGQLPRCLGDLLVRAVARHGIGKKTASIETILDTLCNSHSFEFFLLVDVPYRLIVQYRLRNITSPKTNATAEHATSMIS